MMALKKIIKTVYNHVYQEHYQICSDDEAEIINPIVENLDFMDYCELISPISGMPATEIDNYHTKFRSIISSYDCVLFDTHTGLNELNLSILEQSNIAVLVSTPDAISISDTYALIKASSPYIINVDLCLVINQVLEKKTSLEIYKDLNLALRNFMEREIKLLGLIQTDDRLKNFPGKLVFQQGDPGKISALRQIEEMAPKLLHNKLQNDMKWA